MITAAVLIAVVTAVLILMVLAVELARSAWGQQFLRELDGISWHNPGDITEALSFELIARDNSIHHIV